MTLSKILGTCLFLLSVSCSGGEEPGGESQPQDQVATETDASTEVTPSISDEDWYDPTPKEVIQLPPKWKEAGMHLAMINPHLARERAPDSFKFKVVTTKGELVIECVRAWSPHGVDRVYNLLKIGYFKDIAIYRVEPNFLVQFGIHGNRGVSTAWNKAKIRDDPPFQSNRRGYVSMASMRGPNTRSTELFFNLADNEILDDRGFTPVGRIVEGLSVIDTFNAEYGKQASPKFIHEGNMSIRDRFPRIDWLKTATLIE